MNNTIFSFPKPENEPVLGYKPGSPERKEIRKALEDLYKKTTTICPIIGVRKSRPRRWARLSCPPTTSMSWPNTIKLPTKR